MKPLQLASLATVSTLLITGAPAQALADQAALEPVNEKLRMMEHAVYRSSVTPHLSEEQMAAKRLLIDGAREHLDQGQYKTAVYKLNKAGRLLYPMEAQPQIVLEEDKRQEWLIQMDRAVQSMLPVATELAQEKGEQVAVLREVKASYQLATEAMQQKQNERAVDLMTATYDRLQRAVVTLRSGDEVVIAQPEPGTERAWQEAVRRYEDWRFSADWMAESADSLGADPGAIAQGSERADALFNEAQRLASQQRWLEATKQIDKAYAVMEEHWRRAGIDI